MAKIPDYLTQFLQEITEAAAIIDAAPSIIYSNKNFDELLNIPINNNKKAPVEALNSLNLQKRHAGKIRSPQFLHLPGHNHKIAFYIYLLYKSRDQESIYLVMAKDSKDVSKSKYNVGSTNPYTDEEKLRTEILEPEFNQLIGQNIQFRKALYIAQRAAKSDISLLIIGESGTGKEILAGAIHKSSRRSGKPLIDVNCAAIPDSLIESELFGYEKGAFTGARTEGRKGYFDEAHEGTILLDEIGDASLQTQSKLLRVLESGSFKRVGGSKNIKVDVRVISSTNKDLTELIREKLFREDLYFRLNAFTVYLPPLRERREDIGLLVEHFLRLNAGNEGRNLKFLRSSMNILQAYAWPGNVRELKGVVDYAVNMSTGSIIDPGALPNFLFASDALYTGGCESYPAISDISGDRVLADILRHVEKDLIKDALEKSASKTEAIKKLGDQQASFLS